MKKFALVCVLGVTVLAGCKSVEGTTVEEKRGNVLKMRDATLDELYKEKAAAKGEIADAAGYAVFTNVGINLFVVASGNGYGVVTNSKTDEVTYMNMREVGVGIGMGAKDFRAIFIFKDAKVMDEFIESGWDFGGDADAAAKSEDSGDAVASQISAQGVTIYQLTDHGLALQATLMGTKYWKDDELN